VVRAAWGDRVDLLLPARHARSVDDDTAELGVLHVPRRLLEVV